MKRIILSIVLLTLSLCTQASNIIKHQQLPNLDKQNSLQNTQKKHRVHHDVWLDSISVEQFLDEDNDDYYQQINVSFDLDTRFTAIDVYVKIWQTDSYGYRDLITTTRTFTLQGNSGQDTQQIDILFNEHLASDYYQLTMSIYDSLDDQLLNTYQQYNTHQLADIALEGHQFDHYAHFNVIDASVELQRDNDFDGYYQKLAVDLTIDTNYKDLWLTAEFYINGSLISTSEVFQIHHDSSDQEQHFTLYMPQHLSSSYYDLHVNIIDSTYNYSYQDINAQSWASFGHLPLESTSNDYYQDEQESHDNYHAGNLSIFMIAILSLLLFSRCWQQFNRPVKVEEKV
ncbi:MAG: hypothetical protein HRU25_05645 [Psychrobium sp.]|nr:hypothetical protein [Psychrobium sp.]